MLHNTPGNTPFGVHTGRGAQGAQCVRVPWWVLWAPGCLTSSIRGPALLSDHLHLAPSMWYQYVRCERSLRLESEWGGERGGLSLLRKGATQSAVTSPNW
uniref:Uncharacterized protein n=1 Tax=Eutreptiella gymnastica TaxID=73025 RepID=A0A7S1NPV1_9EUGL|mmetsp:Transcript_70173/g.123753  ORF Transcript_70173/g.123753 Transcript_70173/m.123753 type:complete len:100 (+) Transcript_70173:136-435(+)